MCCLWFALHTLHSPLYTLVFILYTTLYTTLFYTPHSTVHNGTCCNKLFVTKVFFAVCIRVRLLDCFFWENHQPLERSSRRVVYAVLCHVIWKNVMGCNAAEHNAWQCQTNQCIENMCIYEDTWCISWLFVHQKNWMYRKHFDPESLTVSPTVAHWCKT